MSHVGFTKTIIRYWKKLKEAYFINEIFSILWIIGIYFIKIISIWRFV